MDGMTAIAEGDQVRELVSSPHRPGQKMMDIRLSRLQRRRARDAAVIVTLENLKPYSCHELAAVGRSISVRVQVPENGRSTKAGL